VIVATISQFFGISIRMFVRERGVAHFHAVYGSHEATFAIESLRVLEGKLPRRALALVVEWAIAHREELQANWDRAKRHESLRPIDPLD
jgi:hypothetical protein